MAIYGTIVGTKSTSGNLQGTMATHGTHYIPIPAYDGYYEATPTTYRQTFPTADKRMIQDFRVNKTPYSEVSNTAGGTTVTIL